MSSAKTKRFGDRGPGKQELDTLTQRFRQGLMGESELLASALTRRFPKHGFGWKVLGAVQLEQNRFAEALHATQHAIALLPGDAATYNNLGMALLGLNRLEEAEAAIRQALAIAPDYAKALSNLGALLRFQRKFPQAEVCYRHALEIEPGYTTAHIGLGNALELQNRLAEAQASYRTALKTKPDMANIHTDLLHLMSLDVEVEPEQLFAAHAAFGAQFEPPLRAEQVVHTNPKDPARCLQVGFVSGDLNNHALANYLEPTFKFLGQKKTLSLHAYYTRSIDDAETQRMRTSFAQWHAVADLTDAELANKIRADKIDILFDLGGHTVLNRLLAFARKPAPVQASWLGYLGTTGLQAMDYYVADAFWVTPGELDWQFTETLAYLPSAMVFQPSPLSPPVNPQPAIANGHLTFGSFNRHNKITDAVIALWSMLLRAIPDSKMVLAAIPPEYQDGLMAAFEREGIERGRLTFPPRTSVTKYLALHHQTDFCLDTFPHGGGATTAHAAWMGVPTLCLAGDGPASRFGATEMHHLGLDGFIARSIDEFVDKGLYWAEHIAELATLRQGLRARFMASALGQHQHFADNFEAMLRMMWQRWCADLPPVPLTIEAAPKKAVVDVAANPQVPTEQDVATLSYLYEQQLYVEAEPLARRLTREYPEHGLAWKILGGALRQLGRREESLETHRLTAQLRPDDAEAHFNLACELQQQGQLDDAVRSYLRTLGLEPNSPIAYNNLGVIFKTMGLFPEAEMYCRQAITLTPTMEKAHNNLGNALHAQGQYALAQASYRQALALKPDWAEAYNNLAITLKDQGYGSEAKEAYQTALRLKPDWAAAASNLLFCLSLDVHTPPQELHAQHLAFGAKFEAPLRAHWQAHNNTKDPQRLLHIGFVSGDLYDHALANFQAPMFAALAKQPGLALHAYYTHIFDDAVTQRMRASFSHWHAVADLAADALADRIRADGIDILIDLCGHTAHNRLLTFARKPAPIQASWLGYLGTTGLQAMDYYLCDKFWVPPGELDWQFTEKPAYLPAAVVFEPSPLSPPVNPLPALKNGFVTFGSFNRPNKLNPSVIVLWAMLLRDIPNARMVMGGIPVETQAEVLQGFAREGIEESRLSFFSRTNLPGYLTLHHQVDFCLDTFPHGGGATNAHAAWMGVPTLCLAGDSPASRFGATEMNILGLHGFIASSIEDYLAKGRYWTEHIEELAAIRHGMRARFSASAFGQPDLFATNLTALLRTMWQRWCSDLPASPIEVNVSATNKPNDQPLETDQPSAQQLESLADCYSQKRYAEAESLSRLLVDRFPKHGFAWKILGYVCQAQDRYEDSLHPMQQVLALDPQDATLYNNLGVALAALGRHSQAEVNFQKSIAIAPDYGKALVNLGMALRFQGRLQESESCCRRALELDSCDASAHIQLGNALEDQDKLSEAQACYYRADMAHEPRRAVAHSNVLYLMNHDVLVEPEHLFREHVAFGEQFEAPLRADWQVHKNIKDPTRCLQVGFVSGDLCHHALADFLDPAFKFLARRQNLSLHAYYTGTLDDAVTQRMCSYFTHWHPVVSLDDAALAEKIRGDRIDILIDLSGHTAKNRLLTFARKPAPIQASWLGHLGTTGLQAMDYYLCDPFWIPPGELDWQFTEKLAYLTSAVTFQPSPFSPPIKALPAVDNGFITFGSFNRPNKINESVIVLWAMLLSSIPSSRLVLGAMQPEHQEALTQSFGREGIEQSRLTFYPRTHTSDYQTLHHQIDFCLDTFPHGGGATTAHAAWMGVPTLCLAGVTPASRFSASMMHHLGLDKFIAVSIDDYVAKGLYWAEHLDELAAIRSNMRVRFKASAFGQSENFATNFETTLRTMWTNWCSGSPATLIEAENDHTNFDLLQTKATNPEEPTSSIKTFCVAHKALELPLPDDMSVIWLGSAPVQTNGKHAVYHVADVSEEFDAWHTFLGGSSGTFAIYKILSNQLVKWNYEDRVSIFQYRKFMARYPMGIMSKNFPEMYLLKPSEISSIDLRAIHNSVNTPYLLPQPLNIGNLYLQYAASHCISDLLRYTALAVELDVISKNESHEFLNSSQLIPGGVEFGIYPINIFVKIMKELHKVAAGFLANHTPSNINSYQRRAVSFCSERLGSHLLLKELKREYGPKIPEEFLGYIHTITENNIYLGSFK